jgi:UDP-N-acetylglucosamine 2-epimerase (non-hydrolysing)/GDP/UDP-N,N'-diacetylbacillosamine 2-epimerase (hydrolysing)
MLKRVIAVFTGNRAEYGLQYPILKAIAAHPDLEYRLIVSGAHLDSNFGRTLQEIAEDGFQIHTKVKIDVGADTLWATAQAIGSGVIAVSQALAALKPDLLVVYADRFEGFAAVIAGTQTKVPTAHIEGGDSTQGGALDDSVRHAMTKLAHLHFTTNQQATNRILAMGEEPWRVHTVGFPAIDVIREGNFASAQHVSARLNIDPARPIVLFTQHSVTTEFDHAAEQVAPSLIALERLAREGVQVIVTYPNNDAGGRRIISAVEGWTRGKLPNVQVHRSLGRWLYHGVLAIARAPSGRVACVGNSSSGIKETPAFCCPTVNIGSRQLGRLRADNVIDTAYEAAAIEAAARCCLFDEVFRAQCRTADNPYGVGDAGKKVAAVLATIPLDASILRKRMTLKGESHNGWYR